MLALTFLVPAPNADGGKKRKKDKQEATTIEGTFSSTRGVMKPISCYCFDGGYITTAAGDEIAVCFEGKEMEDASRNSEKFTCNRIKVTGIYVEKTRAPENDSPCPAGTIRYLKVSKFECMD